MYLLFRHHNMDPREYVAMGPNTRKVFKAFILQEVEDLAKEYRGG